MGASASVAKVTERANEFAAKASDFVQDVKDTVSDATRVKRSDEIDAVLHSYIDLRSAIDDVKESYRDWSRRTYDILRLPSLSLWTRQSSNFIGTEADAASLHRSSAGCEETAKLILACREAVLTNCVAALERAEADVRAVIRDAPKPYDDAVKALGAAQSASAKAASAPGWESPEGQQRLAACQAELERATAALAEAASATVQAMKAARAPIERGVAQAFEALQAAFAALAASAEALPTSATLTAAIDAYSPTSGKQTLGDTLSHGLRAAEEALSVDLPGVTDQDAAAKAYDTELLVTIEHVDLACAALGHYLQSGLRKVLGPAGGVWRRPPPRRTRDA